MSRDISASLDWKEQTTNKAVLENRAKSIGKKIYDDKLKSVVVIFKDINAFAQFTWTLKVIVYLDQKNSGANFKSVPGISTCVSFLVESSFLFACACRFSVALRDDRGV